MKLIQAEIKAGTINVKLVWTPRWLLSSAPMEFILNDLKKRTASIKITVPSVEDRNSILKNGIWFGGKGLPANGLSEISRDTLYVVCCYWGHITLQFPNMDSPRCLLCTDIHTKRYHKCDGGNV